MTKASHIIKKQVLETRISSKTNAWRLQNELKDIYYSEIISTIETVCNEVELPDNKTFVIDKMELDVGVIKAKDIYRTLACSIENLLRTQIKKALSNSIPSHASTYSVRNSQESETELLKFFLVNGTMPWWGQSLQKQTPDEIAMKLLDESHEKLVALFKENYKNRKFTQRFVCQFSSETYFALIHHFDKSITADVFRFLFDSFTKSNTFHSKPSLNKVIRENLLATAIEYSGTKPTVQQYIFSLVPELINSCSLSADEFYKEMLSYIESVSYSTALKKNSTKEYAQTLQQLIRMSGNVYIKDVGSLQEESNDKLNEGEDTSAKASFKKKLEHKKKITSNSNSTSVFDPPSQPTGSESETTNSSKSEKRSTPESLSVQKKHSSDASSQDAPNLHVSRQELGDPTLNNPSPSATEIETSHSYLNQRIEKTNTIDHVEQYASDVPASTKDEITKSDAIGSQAGNEINRFTKNGVPALNRSIEVFTSSNTESIDIDGVVTESYIQNAGLVILWPYLHRFFTNLKLIENGIFLTDEHRKRGVFILQHLTSNTPELYEYHLMLNKILCGAPIAETLDRSLQITKNETEHCTEFLQAVIQNWASLKNTSVSGFREAFINRNGVLRKGDSGWTLTVERKTYDMLMEQLPWQMGLVKLPWMRKPMMVEW